MKILKQLSSFFFVFLVCNPINNIKIDTVGVAIKGLQVKISNQNEILVKGSSLMKGYWKDKKNTDKSDTY